MAKSRPFCIEVAAPPLKNSNERLCCSNTCGPLQVTYTNTARAAKQWLKEHLSSHGPIVVGWDVESAPDVPWRHCGYIGPATVQISVMTSALVVQIADEKTGPLMDVIKVVDRFLSNPSIVKVGVGIDGDMIELFQWMSSGCLQNAPSRFDIGGVGGTAPHWNVSLRTLATTVLGLDLQKSKKIRIGNWAKAPLNEKQVAYAARDAWVAVAVVQELAQRDPATFSTLAILQHIKDQETVEKLVEGKAAKLPPPKPMVFEIVGPRPENGTDGQEDGLDGSARRTDVPITPTTQGSTEMDAKPTFAEIVRKRSSASIPLD